MKQPILTPGVTSHSNTDQTTAEPLAAPVEELILELTQPYIIVQDDVQRSVATARLIYQSVDGSQSLQSQSYTFVAPIGAIEQQEIRWYIESYYRWPTGVFKTRASKTEQALPQWGKALYSAALADESTQAPLNMWLTITGCRRFSVVVDAGPPADSNEENVKQCHEAASSLLALPWEIMHDGSGYLSQDGHGIQIRRRLPNYTTASTLTAKLPIRVLLLSPRPEITEQGEEVGYLDHRSSAIPLFQAMENLGEALVKVDILSTPTFPALKAALRQAKAQNAAYEIVHFDGHGVYDPQENMGALCFEQAGDEGDENIWQQRVMQLVYADDFSVSLRKHNVPLVYLDACQTAQAQEDPTASVAASLLAEGVGSVVAMSHTVLVETARRFVEPFYQNLAQGQRVGDAMLAGQAALHDDSYRFKIMGAGKLKLQDWFVPVLYQQAADPQLFNVKADEAETRLVKERRQFYLGKLPAPPAHSFVGRSHNLLQLERLLQQQDYAVIQGGGGMGKTTIAIELTRWLVRSERFDRAVYISVESQNVQDIKGIIDSIGRQLLPKYTVAQYGDDTEAALQPIEQELRDTAVLILFDNMESVLPDHKGINPAGVADVTDLLDLCQTLLSAGKTTRLLFTSREVLPLPFARVKNTVLLGRLAPYEAVELVENVMAEHGWVAPETDNAATPEEITELVETVNCHPRALVLLAREVANGVRATTNNLSELMAELEQQNPGERENSLYASVELSLRRLSPEVREQVNKLAVFHGGGHMAIITGVMGIETEAAVAIAQSLIDVGLAELMEYNYLRLDPALPDYLKLGLAEETLAALADSWADAMAQLVGILHYEFFFKDSIRVQSVTLLELPNLLVLVAVLVDSADAEGLAVSVSDMAVKIEQLFAQLGRPQALAQVLTLRRKAAAWLIEWEHARFEHERMLIERLKQQGQLQQALIKARTLLERAKAVGPVAYSGADYDLAVAYALLGLVLCQGRQAEPALALLRSAQELFASLDVQSRQAAERMTDMCLTAQADCLGDLGRFSEAVEIYQERIKLAEQLKNYQRVAVGKAKLASVLLRLELYPQAINEYLVAKSIFSQQQKDIEVATMWHQLGMVYQDAGDDGKAETAYRQALEINTQRHNQPGKAMNLGQLGTLYYHLHRPAEALRFYRQALNITLQLDDTAKEGIRRNNIANILLKLKRYPEARAEITRAIVCDRQLGYAAMSWTAFAILQDIEIATNHVEAAKAAWEKATEAYLDYRRQGGCGQTLSGKLADTVVELIWQGKGDEAEVWLNQILAEEEAPDWYKTFAPKMLAVVKGIRTHALADDVGLDYAAAAEILFLIERLEALDASRLTTD